MVQKAPKATFPAVAVSLETLVWMPMAIRAEAAGAEDRVEVGVSEAGEVLADRVAIPLQE